VSAPTDRSPGPAARTVAGPGPEGPAEPAERAEHATEPAEGSADAGAATGAGSSVGDEGAPDETGDGGVGDDRLRGDAEPPAVRFLQGSFLGHLLHPMLTDLPIGFWTSAWVLDLVGGERSRDAADRLVTLGVLAALPTAATGLADRRTRDGDARRLATVHGSLNALATGCYAASWLLRRRGSRGLGVGVSQVGALSATIAGYLGGKLAFGDAPDGHDASPDAAGPPTGPAALR